MADRRPSLLDSDEEIEAYIQRMLYGTRGEGRGFSIGEGNTKVTGNYSEERSTAPLHPWEVMERPAESRTGSVGLEHSFSPDVSARINAALTPQVGGPPMIQPSAGLNLGPLSLSGGLNIAQQTDQEGNPYTKATPTIGAGLKVPLDKDSSLAANLNITPDQLKILDAAYRRKLLGGELSIGGRYEQPTYGDPKWGVGIRGSFPFRGGLR